MGAEEIDMKKNQARAEAREAPIALLFDKMKPELVDKALEEAGVKVGGSANATRRAEMLDTHYRKTVPKEELIACHVCHGSSNEFAPSCPFCGSSGDDAGQNGKAEAAIVPVSAAAETNAKVARGLAKVGAVTDFTVKALDEANKRILELKLAGALSYWRLGSELGKVFDAQLWKTRVDESGKTLYKAFNQYVERELQISAPSAYAMIDTAKHFTEEQTKRFTRSHLHWVLKAPEAARDEIMQEVEKGAKLSDLKKRVRQARKQHGRPKTGRKEIKTKNPGRKAKLTMALSFGTVVLPLYAKPKEKLEPGKLPDRRAKKLSDLPFALEEVANGVVRYYQVVNAAGGWKLKIETRRPQE